MYKIIVKNLTTGIEFVDYGFSRWIAKRIYFLHNAQTHNYEPVYELEWFLKLDFSWKVFKKCLTNAHELRYNKSMKER